MIFISLKYIFILFFIINIILLQIFYEMKLVYGSLFLRISKRNNEYDLKNWDIAIEFNYIIIF